MVAYPEAEKNALNLTRALANLDKMISEAVEKKETRRRCEEGTCIVTCEVGRWRKEEGAGEG